MPTQNIEVHSVQQNKLLEFAAPLFESVCSIIRKQNSGIRVTSQSTTFVRETDPHTGVPKSISLPIRPALERQLERGRDLATAARMGSKWLAVEQALCCFADGMMVTVDGLKAEWHKQPLASGGTGGAAGAEAFYESFLNPLLKQVDSEKRQNGAVNEELKDQLELYETCLLLGFKGKLYNKKADWNQLRIKIKSYYPERRNEAVHDRFTPDADQFTLTTPLEYDPKPTFWSLGVTAVLFLIAFAAFVGHMGHRAVSERERAISSIVRAYNIQARP